MSPKEEAAFERGERAAWASVLIEACKALGYKTDEGALAAALAERERAVVALRKVCAIHGDNDWPGNLHLADVIEKHLGRHLDDGEDGGAS